MNFTKVYNSGARNRKKIKIARVYPETVLEFGNGQDQGQGDPPLTFQSLKKRPLEDIKLCDYDEDVIGSDDSTQDHSARIPKNPMPIPTPDPEFPIQPAFAINKLKRPQYQKKENPPDLYTQLLYGNRETKEYQPKKEGPVRIFLKNVTSKMCCIKKVTKVYIEQEPEKEVDVGDEDEAIFQPRLKAKRRIWRRLDTLKILLKIFIVVDYLFAWYQYWQSRLGSAENEFTHLQDIYNCEKPPTTAGIGDEIIEVVRLINAFLSFLVLFVSNEHNTTICAYWMGARWIQCLLHSLEYFWLTRFLNDSDLEFEFTWHHIVYLGFNAIGMFLVCYFYYEYSDVIKSRVNRLRGSRVLNLEIDAKHLDEFSQRKAAVRYAGHYQSTLLIKKQIREAKKDRGDPWDLRDPKPEECQFALEEGIRAYKYFRGIPILKIEETGQKIHRQMYLRRKKQKINSLGSSNKSIYSRLKAASSLMSWNSGSQVNVPI